jgi:hypothetical protein
MPPTPLHVSVKAVAVGTPMITSVPLTPRIPDQPPVAVQAVVSVEDHVNVVLAPFMTGLGLATSVTVGAGATDTLAVAALMPPGPVQVRVNAEDIASDALTSVPMVGRGPDQLPEATQLVASMVDHVRVVAASCATTLGAASMVTVGLGRIPTLAVAAAMPLAALQVSVYAAAALMGAVSSVPLVERVPDQLPDAVQLVALLDVHVSVVVAPLATAVGVAESETDTGGAAVSPPPPPPLQPLDRIPSSSAATHVRAALCNAGVMLLLLLRST